MKNHLCSVRKGNERSSSIETLTAVVMLCLRLVVGDHGLMLSLQFRDYPGRFQLQLFCTIS